MTLSFPSLSATFLEPTNGERKRGGLKAYNGFSEAQRNKAQRWLNASWASGQLVKPERCVACGQTHGVIDAHAEDYSEPFRAGVTDGFHLCFICHMQVHCRPHNRRAWSMYRMRVETGWRAIALGPGRNFGLFKSRFLSGDMPREFFEYGEIPDRPVLWEIEQSQDRYSQLTAKVG